LFAAHEYGALQKYSELDFRHMPSSTPKSKHQFWASAACPGLDHDTGELGGVSSSARPLSASCVGIVAAAGGIAFANLYYNQSMLPDIAESFPR
jgi:hypothetical protein